MEAAEESNLAKCTKSLKSSLYPLTQKLHTLVIYLKNIVRNSQLRFISKYVYHSHIYSKEKLESKYPGKVNGLNKLWCRQVMDSHPWHNQWMNDEWTNEQKPVKEKQGVGTSLPDN